MNNWIKIISVLGLITIGCSGIKSDAWWDGYKTAQKEARDYDSHQEELDSRDENFPCNKRNVGVIWLSYIHRDKAWICGKWFFGYKDTAEYSYIELARIR